MIKVNIFQNKYPIFNHSLAGRDLQNNFNKKRKNYLLNEINSQLLKGNQNFLCIF